MRMIGWMCDVKVKDRAPSKETRERLGIDDVILVLLHVLQKEDKYLMNKYIIIIIIIIIIFFIRS